MCWESEITVSVSIKVFVSVSDTSFPVKFLIGTKSCLYFHFEFGKNCFWGFYWIRKFNCPISSQIQVETEFQRFLLKHLPTVSPSRRKNFK